MVFRDSTAICRRFSIILSLFSLFSFLSGAHAQPGGQEPPIGERTPPDRTGQEEVFEVPIGRGKANDVPATKPSTSPEVAKPGQELERKTPTPPLGKPIVVKPIDEGKEETEQEIIIAVDNYLDAPVVTASKKVEKTHEAPAIISVLTQKDIQELAPNTLYDVLSTLPGIEIMETYYGYTSVVFRGIMQTHYNDKNLLLVNGTPLYDTINGSYYLEQLPINAIKQIEVIRGPGSTLYGTNAFAGVISIITFDGTDADRAKFYAKYGMFNTLELGFSGGYAKGPFSVFMSGTRRDTDGYKFFVSKDEDGKSGEPIYHGDRFAYENDYTNIYSNLKLYNVQLGLNYFTNDKDKYGITPALVSTGERHVRGFFTDLRSELSLGKEFNLMPLAWFNWTEKSEDVNWYPPSTALKEAALDKRRGGPGYQEFSGFKSGAELRGDWRLHPTAEVLAGVVYEYTYMDKYVFKNSDEVWTPGQPPSLHPGEINPDASAILDSHYTYDASGYLQANFSILERLGLVGGVRFNYNKDFGQFLAPRFGLVLKLIEGLGLKLLYGRAYRSPSFFEKYVNTSGVLYGGNISYTDPQGAVVAEKLNPEMVDTVDLGLDWVIKRTSFRVNYFYLSTDKMIDRSRTVDKDSVIDGSKIASTTPQYGNIAGYWLHGVELDFHGSPITGMKYFFNLSYKMGREKESERRLHYFAPLLANIGVTYQWLKWVPWLRTSLQLQYVSGRSGPKLEKDATGKYVESGEMSLSPYAILSLNVTAEIYKHLEFSVIGHNLLFQDFAYPEFIRKRVDEVPGGPPASVFGMLTLKL